MKPKEEHIQGSLFDSPESFEAIVLKYRENSINFARRYIKDLRICEDISQEASASVFVYKDRYNPNMSFKTWINNPILAFATQFMIFVSSIMPLQGDYSLYKVFIRHNVMEPLANPQAFYINRIFIAVMSIVLIMITAWFWEIRRRRIGEGIK